jgi:hypothetical protein
MANYIDLPVLGSSGGGTGGSGTVTSVDMTVPAGFTISGNPISTNGTLALGLATENQGTVWAASSTTSSVPSFRALVSTDLPVGTGTVTSVGVALPSIFTTVGSPVTTSGTITSILINEAANSVFAGPNGSTGVPTFRALVGADIPAINLATSGAGGVTGSLNPLSMPATNLATTANAGVTGTLPVPNGGTGLSTLTSGNLIVGAGASVPTFIAPGSSGTVVISNGTNWQSSTLPVNTLGTANLATTGAGGVTGVLPTVNGGTGIATAPGTSGNILISNGTIWAVSTVPVATRLPANLATTGNGGVTGTLPGANHAPINLATSGNGGVTGTLPSTQLSTVTLSTSAVGGVKDVLAYSFFPNTIYAYYSTSAAQTFVSSSASVVNYDTLVNDDYATVTTGGTWKFTCPQAGKYAVTASATITGIAAGTFAYTINIFKGTSAIYAQHDETTHGGTQQFTVNGMVPCALNDTISVKFNQGTGSPLSLNGDRTENYINITRIGN